MVRLNAAEQMAPVPHSCKQRAMGPYSRRYLTYFQSSAESNPALQPRQVKSIGLQGLELRLISSRACSSVAGRDEATVSLCR